MTLERLGDKIISAFWSLVFKAFFIGCPVCGVFFILFIIFNDAFLSEQIVTATAVCVLASFTCCLLVLSRICVLQRKPSAKDTCIEQLWDTDLKIPNESEQVPYHKWKSECKDFTKKLKNLFFMNPYEFSKFRPAYGLILVTGLVFVCAFATALKQAKEWSKQDDFYCTALELTFPMILMISVVYLLANFGIYSAEKERDSYIPFEEHVHIPMKVFVGKTVAGFVNSGNTHMILMLFAISLLAMSVIFSNYIYHKTGIDALLSRTLPNVYPNNQRFLYMLLFICIIGSLFLLLASVLASFVQVKRSILGIIEKNWRRNFVAIEFLLPLSPLKNLKVVQIALAGKRNQHLSLSEQLAFNYIEWPIWRTKQPFKSSWIETDHENIEAAPDDPQKPDAPDLIEQADPEDKGEETKQKSGDRKKQQFVCEEVEAPIQSGEVARPQVEEANSRDLAKMEHVYIEDVSPESHEKPGGLQNNPADRDEKSNIEQSSQLNQALGQPTSYRVLRRRKQS